ncbi:DUF5304 domain-containing protein [Streptomyces fuscigenes]|uniref:DUF5304 domain-containing protein n=1 Tax=Streptomyces fuscigenes TaxID=1528880 RepID=UPI001F3AE5C2|nr:DUF5304 domain-containing protein [Streptomyces fuscigenes]MCF3962775.1 DUF5304 domain-containing protein [Streptomyces fuscigenes]
MSDASERPDADPDAWAAACEEDLAAEKARRRAEYGPPPASAADELRRFADTVADRLTSVTGPLFGAAGQGAVQQFLNQARAAVEPVIDRNPGLFDHLAAAGNELLAAYRSAVEDQEGRWTRGAAADEGATRKGEGPKAAGSSDLTKSDPSKEQDGATLDPKDSRQSLDPSDPRDEPPGPDGHIDLD